MFTGLVQRVGTLTRLVLTGTGAELTVRVANPWPDSLVLGESIAVQGACLTVTKILPDGFTVDVLKETLNCTAFTRLREGSRVNLERALAVGDRMGGHMVQGHVDALGAVKSFARRGQDIVLRVAVESAFLPYLVYKGSIAIDGVSLTISAVSDEDRWFEVSLIPTTLRETSLSDRKDGDWVNLEADIVGRYVERFLAYSPKGEKGSRGLSPLLLDEMIS